MITSGAVAAALVYAGTAAATDWERQNQPVRYCVDGQVQERLGALSGVLDAARRGGLKFDNPAAQEVARGLQERNPNDIHPNTWISVGLDPHDKQPLVAYIGSCARNFGPDIPYLGTVGS